MNAPCLAGSQKTKKQKKVPENTEKWDLETNDEKTENLSSSENKAKWRAKQSG